LPIAFGDEELHRIVAIAHADEAVTVLREELLRTLLPRLEMQPDPRVEDSGERRGGVARAGPAGAIGEAR